MLVTALVVVVVRVGLVVQLFSNPIGELHVRTGREWNHQSRRRV